MPGPRCAVVKMWHRILSIIVDAYLRLQDDRTALMVASIKECVNALIEALPAADRNDAVNAKDNVCSGQDVALYLIDHR